MQRLVQLALDLWGGGTPAPTAPGALPPAPAPHAPDSGALRADSGQNRPPALDAPGPDAIKKVAERDCPPAARPADAPPAEPLGTLLAPAIFRHPRAQREVLLGDALIGYALQRARRRSIGFTVGPDGLAVRAPGWVTIAGIEQALQEKSDWILRKLAEAQARQDKQASGRIVWRDGAVLPYLGAPLTVVLDPTHGFTGQGAALVDEPAADPAGGAAAPARTLRVGLSRGASPEQVRDAVQAWLMRAARSHFTRRLDHFAPLLGVRWTRLRLSSAETRWGSAKTDGSIRLNWRLLHYAPAVIDYVVAHELAHLRVMDHSPRFWDTVASVMPDYAGLRNQLRDQPAPLWE